MMAKVILVIRDGWGYRAETADNAIAEAGTPISDRLMQEYPNVLLNASEESVGLPEGYEGNSEVGHMTIGSGRIILEAMVKINNSIKSGEFFSNPAFLGAVENCKKNNTALHIIGLLQHEGVHAHIAHLFALLELCKQQNFYNVYIHVITDGRDAPVTESEIHIVLLINKMRETGVGKIVTITGRYYIMDRDKRWERTKLAYDCLVYGQCEEIFEDSQECLNKCHANSETDEFIRPRKLKGYEGIKDNDSVIFYNFRTDRTRQLTRAIVEEQFEGWERKPLNVFYVAMTEFYKPMNAHVAFKDEVLVHLLGETISNQGIKQLRISETEKYAHVTFFFNGQIETPYQNEDRILIPSPKVATYDLRPEMNSYEVGERLVEEINSEKYGFIVVNLVNGDLVGHTGVVEAIKKAIRAVDKCEGKIVDAGLQHGYTIMIFADHGNAEDQTPQWKTSHTLNPVPFILVSEDTILKNCKLKLGKGLSDVAPTVLDILGIPKPSEMTGESLIEK